MPAPATALSSLPEGQRLRPQLLPCPAAPARASPISPPAGPPPGLLPSKSAFACLADAKSLCRTYHLLLILMPLPFLFPVSLTSSPCRNRAAPPPLKLLRHGRQVPRSPLPPLRSSRKRDPKASRAWIRTPPSSRADPSSSCRSPESSAPACLLFASPNRPPSPTLLLLFFLSRRGGRRICPESYERPH